MSSVPYDQEPPHFGYPVDVVAEYPEHSSRGYALTAILFFVKMFALVPHFIVLWFLSIASMVVWFIGYWAVLFTGQYPEGLWRFAVGGLRWQLRVGAWLYGITDEYPPFTLDGGNYPVDIVARYPGNSSRLLAFTAILFFLKAMLLIPHIIALYFVGLAASFVAFIGYWAVLFTGTYPRGMWEFLVGAFRWNVRMQAWLIGITDEYPPFSLSS